MGDFVECRDCGFVLYGENSDDPAPRGWTSCPDCEGTDFQFTNVESR